MIALKQICKRYDSEHLAVNNINLTIASHEFLAIVGSSGSGKSTTLKMINRLIAPSSGEILIDDVNICDIKPLELRRNIGYVFQHIGLFPHMNIYQNLAEVLQLYQCLNIETRIKQALEFVNLDYEKVKNRFPDEISGGQQQRVGVARALLGEPNILLMDEPFGALDAINRQELQDELQSLHQKLKKTTVFVTHDLQEAFKLADRIAIFHHGHIEQIDTAENIIKHPKTEYVQTLVKTMEATCLKL